MLIPKEGYGKKEILEEDNLEECAQVHMGFRVAVPPVLMSWEEFSQPNWPKLQEKDSV